MALSDSSLSVCRNTRFYILILYPVTLLNLLVLTLTQLNHQDFLYIIYHLHIITVLLLPLQFRCLFFLTALSRTSKLQESEYACLFPDLRRKAFNFSSLSITLTVDLSYTISLMLRYIPCITTLLSFYHLYIYCELCMAYRQKSH